MGNSKGETPKTYSLRVSENAFQDIDNITGYIAFVKHEPISAIRIGDEIFATIGRIERNPLAFRECEEILSKSKMYRKAVCMSWLIIYRIKASNIVVLGVIYASRRLSRIKGLRKVK
jgi:plasmid stabilization system protein ParE